MNRVPGQPESLDELRGILRAESSVLAIGRRTKPPLSDLPDVRLVSLNRLTGIIQYEPSEFTFTAWAGTRLAEVVAAVSEKNQYLPFDPMLAAAGATIGGTVAAGLAGPGRFRFGGIRDFLLGVQLITGDAEVVRAGGSVVKNAAGFDIPKLMVGSLGRLGVMTQLTFKVFPEPSALQTYRVPCDSDAQAIERAAAAATSRWELDAVDYRPDLTELYLRQAGSADVNQAIGQEILSSWNGVTRLQDAEAHDFWQSTLEFGWVASDALVAKVPTTPTSFVSLSRAVRDLKDGSLHLSVAGAVAWVSVGSQDSLIELDRWMREAGLSGLVVRGPCRSIWLGKRKRTKIEAAIKQAMDPVGRFPSPFR